MIKPTVESEADQPANEGQALATALVEALQEPFPPYAEGSCEYRRAVIQYQDERKRAAALIQSQGVEIADGDRAIAALQFEIEELTALCEAREAADAKNSELLEAAVEGQTYWQTRCQTLERALRWALGNLNFLAADTEEAEEAKALLSTLSEEARDAG